MRETICLLGNPSAGRLSMGTLAAESGWSFEHARDFGRLREIGDGGDVVAVFIDASTLGVPIREALRAVYEVLPGAFPIVCHKSSEPLRWPELSQAGAFHALLTPLCENEVRQSLGFVWDAQRRREAAAESGYLRQCAS
jgi:hypothetical protein